MFEQLVALRAAADTREVPSHTKPFNFNGRTYFCRHEWLPDWENREMLPNPYSSRHAALSRASRTALDLRHALAAGRHYFHHVRNDSEHPNTSAGGRSLSPGLLQSPRHAALSRAATPSPAACPRPGVPLPPQRMPSPHRREPDRSRPLSR
jgi:hypothetical protein